MEQSIKQLVTPQEAQIRAVHLSSTIKENQLLKEIVPDEMELTEEEQEEILRGARREKARKFREIEYWNKVNTPKLYKKYDKKEMWQFALNRGKDLIEDFKVDEASKRILGIINLYFAGDEDFVKRAEEYTNEMAPGAGLKFSLNKGLLLYGPVGCGKTTLMRLFSTNPNNAFAIISTRKVATDYAKKEGGEQLVEDEYCGTIPVYAHNYFGQTEIGICFDDLGTEENKAHFSNRLNVMEFVLLNRYDNHQLKGKTHVTTNLTISQIEKEYGERVKSRMMEMFNFILFDSNAEDRRR